MMRIKSEEPIDHWGFLNIKDRVILDLGCAIFHSTISTADWFMQNGAKKVIGVDLGGNNYGPGVEYLALSIDSPEKVKNLLDLYKPDVLKADIEGSEIHFCGVDSYDSIKELAIEYHDANLKEKMLQLIHDKGFEIKNIYQLGDIELERMGVIHAIKK